MGGIPTYQHMLDATFTYYMDLDLVVLDGTLSGPEIAKYEVLML